MSFLVPLIMFSWIPVVLMLFATVRPAHRAVIAAYLVAWLFLPMAGYPLQGLPDYTKMSATSAGVLLGALIFDPSSFSRFRFAWFDWPICIWCLIPFASSISNGLGAYDGAAVSLNQTVTWGLPYFIGRLYFTSLKSIRDLAIAIMIGGLVYVPLCLYEIRMSPQLHTMVYGFHQHSYGQSIRFGGYRPTVFMQHGLMVGMWMCMSALIAFWLWYAGRLRQLKIYPFIWFVIILIVVAILCKSAGAILLTVLGLSVLWLAESRHKLWPFAILIAIVPFYIGMRAPGIWSGAGLLDAASMINEERQESLKTRLENEDMLAQKALQRPLLGWGGWGRNRVYNDYGEDTSITDGLWIISLGINGLIGVSSIFAALLLPTWIAMRNISIRHLDQFTRASVQALSVIVVLYAIDCLLNAMINPIFMLTTGSLGGAFSIKKKNRN